MSTGGDERRAGTAASSCARPAATPAGDGVSPASSEVNGPATPRGTETWVQAAEAGGGEVWATKDTPEPDSLGG